MEDIVKDYETKKVSKLHDNFEPSLSNDIKVDKKVQRLEGEESDQ